MRRHGQGSIEGQYTVVIRTPNDPGNFDGRRFELGPLDLPWDAEVSFKEILQEKADREDGHFVEAREKRPSWNKYYFSNTGCRYTVIRSRESISILEGEYEEVPEGESG